MVHIKKAKLLGLRSPPMVTPNCTTFQGSQLVQCITNNLKKINRKYKCNANLEIKDFVLFSIQHCSWIQEEKHKNHFIPAPPPTNKLIYKKQIFTYIINNINVACIPNQV